CSADLLDLHSFPTRRSSDLRVTGLRSADICQLSPGSSETGRNKLNSRECNSHFSPIIAAFSKSFGSLCILCLDVVLRPCKSQVQDRKSTRLNSSHVKISYAV